MNLLSEYVGFYQPITQKGINMLEYSINKD